MFSIIIPTMWKFSPFIRFIGDLAKNPLVGEIIIINNNVEATPNSPILLNEKVKMHNFDTNTFVNPAWNYGVKHSIYDKLCIMNDDLIYDIRVFDKLNNILTPDVGLIGILTKLDQNNNICKHNGDISITTFPFCTTPDIWYVPWQRLQEFNFMSAFGMGQLMFMHKSNWHDIPPELLIYAGDCFIYDLQQLRGKLIYGIDMWHYTPFSATSKDFPELRNFISNESPFYDKILGNLKKEYFLKSLT